MSDLTEALKELYTPSKEAQQLRDELLAEIEASADPKWVKNMKRDLVYKAYFEHMMDVGVGK